MPLLFDVPNFSGIRIHKGNRPEDTEGCIIVGDDPTEWNDDWVGSSAAAYDRLFALIEAAEKRGDEVWLTVFNGPPQKGAQGPS